MAEVLPLVLDKTTGKIREMQTGDTLAVYAKEVDYKNLENEDITVIKKGAPVYLSSANKVKNASASSSGTSNVRGLAMQRQNPGQSVPVQSDGVLVATKQEWDEALGIDVSAVGYTPTGLTPGQDYFLSLLSGTLTSTPPSGSGQSICYIGRADSDTDMDIQLDRPMNLT